MIIEGYDLVRDEAVTLTASMTTEHPCSSYGQPVMLIDEWDGGVMSHANWVLIGARVIEISDDEIAQYKQWAQLFALMAGQ